MPAAGPRPPAAEAGEAPRPPRAPLRLVDLAVGQWLPWVAILGILLPSAFGVPLNVETRAFLRDHGVAAVILLAALAYVPSMVRAHQDLASAVQRFCEMDDFKHREVVGVLQVLSEDMRDTKGLVRDLVRQTRGEADGRGQ